MPVIETRPAGDRVVVAVRGELDLDAGQVFQRALRRALACSVRGVDLDLGAVVFCDCSALNILISLRHRALTQGKTIVVTAAAPVAERLLALTGTRPLFSADAEAGAKPE
ncbi:STAS domain-containing protein [Streptomyces anandii]|uniref:STAS domain-containing protein n=1 Tax=Streptomyces anandii TaxID=285454 RepID=UPI00368C5828